MSEIHFILQKCLLFSQEQNLKLLKIFIEMGVKIIEGGDGSRINLDRLTLEQILELKNKVIELSVVDEQHRI